METDFVMEATNLVPINAAFRHEDSLEKTADADSPVRTFPRLIHTPASTWALSRTRRVMDFIAAATALALFLPLMGLLAVAVRLGSPGPVLFKQKRMGRNGSAFTLYKFRSMHVKIGHSSHITVAGDNRVTGIGKFLRKYKLDELPQFWNILRGDMGLVGPRPKLPHLEPLHMPFRPGITGAATLAFRFEEEMLSQVPREHLAAYYDRFVKPSKANIDLEYMQSATLKTDFGILLQTARSCWSSSDSTYQVVLPEYTDAMHGYSLEKAGTAQQPSQRINAM